MTDDKDRDAAAEILERWIKFRESQGWTREAAKAELATAARALLVAQSRDEGSDFKLTNPTR
jgi:hypothetical protein